MERYIATPVREDLRSKMVFVGGPRQVGKTTLALGLLPEKSEKSPAYFTWDSVVDRTRLLREELPPNSPLIVFDEIHKYRKWRNLIKGIYDKNKSSLKILVTGSARLDYYRRGGDSLQGRYHFYRLHPFSIGELTTLGSKIGLDTLLEFGGFPEPLFKANKRHWRRWQQERISRVLNDDLINLEQVADLSAITLLADALPSRVGSPLSIKSLAEDLEVAHKSVKRWLDILTNLYVCFTVLPYGAPKIRAVKKSSKIYLWDWSLCEDPGARFENLVASNLLKYCHWVEDTEGYQMDLRYIRDTDKREVDFLVLRNKKPLFAIECKLTDSSLSPHLYYFKERTGIPVFYQTTLAGNAFQKDGIKSLPFDQLVREIGLP